MLLWLKSKFAMIVAGIIIISAVTSFFYYQRDQIDSESMQTYCDKISNTVRNMHSSNVDSASHQIYIDEGEGGIELPTQIGGDTYELIFYPHTVAIEQDGHTRGKEFGLRVHLWNPAGLERIDRLYDDEAERMDEANSNIRVWSHEVEVIHIKMLRMCNGSEEVNRVFIFEGEN